MLDRDSTRKGVTGLTERSGGVSGHQTRVGGGSKRENESIREEDVEGETDSDESERE